MAAVMDEINRDTHDLYRLDAPTFTAGVLVDYKAGLVTEASPILRYVIGNPIDEVLLKAHRHGWDARMVSGNGDTAEYRETLGVLRKTRLK